MTVKQLRAILAQITDEDREIKVWLPGSTISLEFNGGKPLVRKGAYIIEGNVDEGSALMRP